MKPKICLGGAQIGIKKYGITNKVGKIKNSEVIEILARASKIILI